MITSTATSAGRTVLRTGYGAVGARRGEIAPAAAALAALDAVESRSGDVPLG
ncbi:hypothetical protein AB0D74_22145 [Streptomyces sp. NPDC048278]|uniref:hypothetical protein n=1 Tax=Streptomyces sp. NPDC048278 TaxID=3155809 RepID=UPI003412518A